MSSLGEVIKKMAVGANDAKAPTSVLFGTVTKLNPLEITVEQKLKLTKDFLILTKNVKDYTVYVDVDWNTEREALNANHSHTMSGSITVNSSTSDESISITNTVKNNLEIKSKNIDLSHSHSITGKKRVTIHNGLELNDNVILLQQQGGNNYIVVDKF